VIVLLAIPAAIRVAAQGPGLPPQAMDVEGELEVHIEDSDQGSHVTHFLNTPAGQLRLQFPADAPSLLTGTRVRAHGTLQNNTLDLSSSRSSLNVVALASRNTFGAQSALVILVNFQDAPLSKPYTVADAQDVTFNQGSAYFKELSYGQMSLSGTVVGWFTIPLSSTSCDLAKIASLAEQAASGAGVNVSAYSRRFYAFPQTSACAFSGRSSLGGSPSKSWINGEYWLGIIGHEFGHQLGLYHSHSRPCDSTGCTSLEYGDYQDVLGHIATLGHFTAFQKERIGWLNYGVSPPVQVVTTSGDYWVDAYETATLVPKALKILKSIDGSTGAKTWYYVEVRTANGFDGMQGMRLGVVVHTGTDGSGNSSYELDMDPVTTTWDSVLDMGQSYMDGGLTVTPISAGATGALVRLSIGGTASATCTAASPLVTFSPTQTQSLLPGAAFPFTVSVSNRDGSVCAPASVNLISTAPAGWSLSWASPTLTVAPGATAATTLTVTAPSTAADGSYPVSATATNGSTGLSGSATGTFVIASTSGGGTTTHPASLAVRVSAAQMNYQKSDRSVPVSAQVTMNTAPAAGVNVSFVVTDPAGSVSKGNVKTDANGNATYTIRLNMKAVTGTYNVTATAATGGASASGTTSFVVQ
jgi:hypothetical protein